MFPLSQTQSTVMSDTNDAFNIIRLWCLRALVTLDGHKIFLKNGPSNGELAEFLGLTTQAGTADFDGKKALRALKQNHAHYEAQADSYQVPQVLQENVAAVAALVGLSETECRMLEFVVLLHMELLLESAMECLGDLTISKVALALSVVLKRPLEEVKQVLTNQSPLIRSGLIKPDRRYVGVLRCKLHLLSDQFADRMLSEVTDPDCLISDRVVQGQCSQLGFDDYGHLAQQVRLLRCYLEQVKAQRKAGVNVLLYGEPGTGKTELAKLLAEHLGYIPYEVSSQDEDGDTVDGDSRLRALRMAQAFFQHKGTVLIFDEAEDIFNDGNWFGEKSTAQTHKGWMNRMLETNPVPVLWITNTIECMDPAFVRRFDIALEVPLPTKHQREHILLQECDELLDKAAKARIGSAERLSPAVISRAAEVVRIVRNDFSAEEVPRVLELLIENTLVAQGHPRLSKAAGRLPDYYDPRFIQADADLAAVAQGIGRAGSARLCLYGPPGTGKTAYGHWLADQLGVPLHIKRGSDLLSKWVGGTEDNIARAFREAESDGAVLLLDEVDSFLQDRREARVSWEVSGVNEMLTQMESYEGVFIATTNLMANLDQAALRRFDLKVKFDYLHAAQAWELLLRQCNALGLGKPTQRLRLVLDQIVGLTPGDFAAVTRQSRFQPIQSAQALVVALAKECAVKNEGIGRKIGFV